MDTNDQELFDAVASGTPVETPAVVAEQPEAQPAITRDDSGRFAAKANETQPEQPADQAGKPEPAIPPSRLREEAEARRSAERERDEFRAQLRVLMDMQKPQAAKPEEAPKPEIWDNPDAWVGQHLGTVKSEVQQTREFYSRRFAEQQHGADKVSEAYEALNRAIGERQLDGAAVKAKLMQSMDPYGDIMAWHGEHSLRSEIGNDPKAYEQKIIEKYLASQQQAAPPVQAAGGSVVRIPTSLNRTTSAASNATSGGADQVVGDDALFNQITSSRRR